MKKWEDIVKDKLAGYESPLPEGSLARFRARRESVVSEPSKKRFPLFWMMATAVAAGLGAFLLLRRPEIPEDAVRIVQPPVDPVAAVTDSVEVIRTEEPLSAKPLIAQAVIPEAVGQPAAAYEDTGITEKAVDAETAETVEETTEEKADEAEVVEKVEETMPVIPDTSPYVPEKADKRPVKLNVLPAAGLIAGGGLVTAVLAPFFAVQSSDAFPNLQDLPTYVASSPGGHNPEPYEPNDKLTGYRVHQFPIKGGLSVGIPVGEKVIVTTGLEYSLYCSHFNYTISGERKQLAHYLGIPLRLDLSLASSRWLDAYIGAGLQGDYCIGATLDGERIEKDGFSLSLLGAGGLQFNITKNLGLFVEPELSWAVPWEDNVLETYRSRHPIMFSVGTGLRVNLGR